MTRSCDETPDVEPCGRPLEVALPGGRPIHVPPDVPRPVEVEVGFSFTVQRTPNGLRVSAALRIAITAGAVVLICAALGFAP